MFKLQKYNYISLLDTTLRMIKYFIFTYSYYSVGIFSIFACNNILVYYNNNNNKKKWKDYSLGIYSVGIRLGSSCMNNVYCCEHFIRYNSKNTFDSKVYVIHTFAEVSKGNKIIEPMTNRHFGKLLNPSYITA